MKNVHELKALAEFLIAEKAESFDMRVWFEFASNYG